MSSTLPILNLYNKYVIIIAGGNSVQGMSVPNNLGFGKVNEIGAVAGKVRKGDSILFKTENAISITWDNGNYLAIPENDIVLIEDPEVPQQ